jgi:hypothetical protein
LIAPVVASTQSRSGNAFSRLAEGQFYFSHKWVLFSRVEGVLAIISPRRAKKAAVRWFRAIFRRQGFVWGVVKADIED